MSGVVSYFTRRVHASDDTKVQETPERCLENFTTSFKRLHCPCIRIFSVYKYVCVCVCVSLSKYSISSSSSYLARAYPTVLIYLPLNLFIFHDHSDSNLQSRHFVHETSDFHLEFVRPSRDFPFLSVPLSTSQFYISFFQFLQTLSFQHSQRRNVCFLRISRCLESSIIFHKRGETTLASVLITAETPELLQRRRSLVSAGRRLHRHRGWLHGSEGGSGQTVVVHVTRRPRPADPYSRSVHRWRAA